MKILIIDDDPIGTKMIQFLLSEEGYEVISVDNHRGAMQILAKELPDLILLDVQMPQVSGFEFYEQLVKDGYDVPVIFITAKGELEDRLRGLHMGADDYITKPFAPAEMLARVQAVLRRYNKSLAHQKSQTIKYNGLEVLISDLSVVLPSGKKVLLTPTEMKILSALLQRPGQVIGRNDLLSYVWGSNYVGESNIIDVYIRRLRRKIEVDPERPAYIQAARGIGYRFAAK